MKTLVDLFYRLEEQARPDLLMTRVGSRFETVDAGVFARRVRCCAAAIGTLGVGRGDRVGLICSNRPDWHVIDFACHLQGAILVPLFSTLTPVQVRRNFADSGCKVIFAEGGEQLEKVAGVRAELNELAHLVLIEATAVDGEGDAADLNLADTTLDELVDSTSPGGEFPGPESGASVATIIYTSGTTGLSKGVMLTHDNLISNMIGAEEVLSCRSVDTALSILPLCHIFQRIVDYTFFHKGAQIAYGSPLRLAEEYLLVRPTVVAGVPRLFERFRAAVMERVAAGSPMKRRLFHWAERVGRRHAEHELLGRPFGVVDRMRHAVADRLVLRKVRDGTGGRIYHFVSGGAALDPSLNWWFESMGLRLLQGYGLTETSPVISANPHDANRVGTVGILLRGVEVRIADDGEILTRGPQVMKGYWNNPGATAEVIVDGWLHTGDIGEFGDGYLKVTDRKKHLIVTSTGKNVAPQPLENTLSQSAFIDQVAVVGDGERFIAALIVPDFAILRTRDGRSAGDATPETLCADAEVIALIQREIDALQGDFARFERVRAFRLLPTPFSIEDGTLTPTFKAVRREVEAKYSELIHDIYQEDDP